MITFLCKKTFFWLISALNRAGLCRAGHSSIQDKAIEERPTYRQSLHALLVGIHTVM